MSEYGAGFKAAQKQLEPQIKRLTAEVAALKDQLAAREAEFTEQVADKFKAAGYSPQVIWFGDNGGEWQLWLYPRGLNFSKHYSGKTIASVLQQGLEYVKTAVRRTK